MKNLFSTQPWHKHQNCDVESFCWFTFTDSYSKFLPTFLFGLLNNLFAFENTQSKPTTFMKNCHFMYLSYVADSNSLSLGVCACTFLLCMPDFFCVDREQIGPVQIATWVFVQYNEVNLYVMSICSFFFYCVFCKCMIFWLWTIFLICFVLLCIWRTGTIPNQCTSSNAQDMFCMVIFVFYSHIDSSFDYIIVTHSSCHITSQTVHLVLPLFDLWCPPKIPLLSRNTAYLCWYWHPDIVFCSLYYLHWVWWGSALWKTDCLTGKHPS